jgi:multisubunit Na+/H+ antiporter MnhF subunit
MSDWVLNSAFGLLTGAILLGLFRVVQGPSVMDRVMAFDLITTCVVGMIVVLSIKWHTLMYLELILIFSLLGFLTTVAFVFYFHQTIESSSRTPGDSNDTDDSPPSSS